MSPWEGNLTLGDCVSNWPQVPPGFHKRHVRWIIKTNRWTNDSWLRDTKCLRHGCKHGCNKANCGRWRFRRTGPRSFRLWGLRALGALRAARASGSLPFRVLGISLFIFIFATGRTGRCSLSWFSPLNPHEGICNQLLYHNVPVSKTCKSSCLSPSVWENQNAQKNDL